MITCRDWSVVDVWTSSTLADSGSAGRSFLPAYASHGHHDAVGRAAPFTEPVSFTKWGDCVAVPSLAAVRYDFTRSGELRSLGPYVPSQGSASRTIIAGTGGELSVADVPGPDTLRLENPDAAVRRHVLKVATRAEKRGAHTLGVLARHADDRDAGRAWSAVETYVGEVEVEGDEDAVLGCAGFSNGCVGSPTQALFKNGHDIVPALTQGIDCPRP